VSVSIISKILIGTYSFFCMTASLAKLKLQNKQKKLKKIKTLRTKIM